MRALVAAFALTLGLLATPVLAEDAKPGAAASDSTYGALEQVQLSDDQVKHYVASLAEMQAAMGDAPADAAEPDAKTMAKLEAIAKKYGFKDFNEYNTVGGNLAIVLDGVDPDSKKYVGAEKMIQRSIEETKKDKQMPDADKKAALADLQAQLKNVTQIKYKSNIDLALKYYDQLGTDEKQPEK
jgi:hypothetical protein